MSIEIIIFSFAFLLILVFLYIILKQIRGVMWDVRAVKMQIRPGFLAVTQQPEHLDHLLQTLDWPRGILPPTRGWAASPDFLNQVAERVLKEKPNTVVELGSGVSSLVIGRCLQLNGEGKLFSFDHSDQFGTLTRQRIAANNLADWVNVIHAPLKKNHIGWHAIRLVFDRPVSSRHRSPGYRRASGRYRAVGAVSCFAGALFALHSWRQSTAR